jgi:hypothetical protein
VQDADVLPAHLAGESSVPKSIFCGVLEALRPMRR